MSENDKIIKNIISTMEVESLNVDDSCLNILNEYISNDLNENQVTEKIKNAFKENL